MGERLRMEFLYRRGDWDSFYKYAAGLYRKAAEDARTNGQRDLLMKWERAIDECRTARRLLTARTKRRLRRCDHAM